MRPYERQKYVVLLVGKLDDLASIVHRPRGVVDAHLAPAELPTLPDEAAVPDGAPDARLERLLVKAL